MKYCAAYYSDIGIQKETNQDSLLLVQRGQTQDDEAVLAVICDGVGGLKMGERSSAAVVTASGTGSMSVSRNYMNRKNRRRSCSMTGTILSNRFISG